MLKNEYIDNIDIAVVLYSYVQIGSCLRKLNEETYVGSLTLPDSSLQLSILQSYIAAAKV